MYFITIFLFGYNIWQQNGYHYEKRLYWDHLLINKCFPILRSRTIFKFTTLVGFTVKPTENYKKLGTFLFLPKTVPMYLLWDLLWKSKVSVSTRKHPKYLKTLQICRKFKKISFKYDIIFSFLNTVKNVIFPYSQHLKNIFFCK